MKKTTITFSRILSIFLILYGFGNLHAQSVLWKITDKTSHESYLYGTIHITDSRVFEWSDSVFARIEKCDLFAGEIDMNPSNLLKAATLMMLPGKETLKDRFSESDYEKIRMGLKACSGYDLSLFNKLKPPALMGLCVKNDGNGLGATVDEMLYQHAQSKGLMVNGLETIEEQIAMFDLIPDSFIVDYFNRVDELDSDMEQLIDLYCKGQLDRLYKLMMEEETDAFMNQELIVKRNHRMTERMIPLIREKSAFFAVGAGHLPGEEGIIALLKKAGFTVEPLLLNDLQ